MKNAEWANRQNPSCKGQTTVTNQRKLEDHEIPSFDEMVEHVMVKYALATRNQRVYDVGYFWYNTMRQECMDVAATIQTKRVYDLDTIIDVMAIISPSNPWENNKRETPIMLEAADAFDSEVDRIAYAMNNSVQTPYGWANHRKAWSVADGAKFECKPTCLKTWSFAECAKYPDSSLEVCVDQHIVHILINDGRQGSIRISPKQYKLFVSVIRKAAELLGMLPLRVQAIIWQQRQFELGYMVDAE